MVTKRITAGVLAFLMAFGAVGLSAVDNAVIASPISASAFDNAQDTALTKNLWNGKLQTGNRADLVYLSPDDLKLGNYKFDGTKQISITYYLDLENNSGTDSDSDEWNTTLQAHYGKLEKFYNDDVGDYLVFYFLLLNNNYTEEWDEEGNYIKTPIVHTYTIDLTEDWSRIAEEGLSVGGYNIFITSVDLIGSDDSTPQLPEVDTVMTTTYTSVTDAVRINWNAVEGADGYRVYRYDEASRKYKSVKTLGKGNVTTYRDSGLEAGKVYKYKVKAFTRLEDGTPVWGAASKELVTAADPAKPAITKIGKAKTAVRLYWNMVECSGYKIQQYDSKSKTWKTIKLVSANKTNYRINGLKSGTAYKFRIQAFTRAGDTKSFSKWSAAKKATTKK